MLLRDWMRAAEVDDAALAEKIGDLSAFTVRKLRYRERGPSIRVAARIEELSGGMVRAPDLQPVKSRRTPAEASS
ncbi:hypothetical protein [Methylobacterium gossipiicola]|nr:hypothetical protein [Methylobacterium gossipiicola]